MVYTIDLILFSLNVRKLDKQKGLPSEKFKSLKQSIDVRPEFINQRTVAGHFEIDATSINT